MRSSIREPVIGGGEIKTLQNLKPIEMVELARARSKLQFERALDAPALLVRISHPDGDLVRSLAEGAAGPHERLSPTIGYETVLGPQSESFRVGAPSSRIPRSFGAMQLLGRLVRGEHFVVPLRKRSMGGKSFSERISLGRALNNDIVLRHASVSKFHAWFQCDDEDGFYLADASSKNGSTVNGEPMPRNTPSRLTPGDEVAFGEVVAIYCPAGMLWEVINNRSR